MRQVEDALKKSFGVSPKKGELLLEGKIYKDEICFSLGYLPKNQIKQLNFETSIDYSDNRDSNVMNDIYSCIDGATAMFQTYLEDEETEFPAQWQEFQVEGKKVFIQLTTTNSALEQQANRLLTGEDGLTKPPLVRDDDTD